MAELIVRTGKHAGKRLVLPLLKDVVLGRDPGCQIQLNSQLVSRRHCQLRETVKGLVLCDLKSQNGTFVNDVAVTKPIRLKGGDVLRVGAIEFEVFVPIPTQPGGFSEDDVADWLSDDAIPTPSASDRDTAEITRPDDTSTSGISTPEEVPVEPTSAALDAAAIIRQRWMTRKQS